MRQMQQNMPPPLTTANLEPCENVSTAREIMHENKKTQIYTDTLANQQKTLNKIQQSQENKITNISAHQTNIDQLQTIINALQ